MTRLLRPPTHEFPRVFSREEGNAVEEALLGIVTTINNYLSNYILIILLLGMGRSVVFCANIATLSIVLLAMLKAETRFTFKSFIDA